MSIHEASTRQKLNDDLAQLSPPSAAVEIGQRVLMTYGSHHSTFLLVPKDIKVLTPLRLTACEEPFVAVGHYVQVASRRSGDQRDSVRHEDHTLQRRLAHARWLAHVQGIEADTGSAQRVGFRLRAPVTLRNLHLFWCFDPCTYDVNAPSAQGVAQVVQEPLDVRPGGG